MTAIIWYKKIIFAICHLQAKADPHTHTHTHTHAAGKSVGEGLPATTQDRQVDMHSGVYGILLFRLLNVIPYLYSSPNIIWVIKSKRMRWAGHEAHMGRREVYKWFWWGNPRERDHLLDSGLERRIILRWIQELEWGAWTVWIWRRRGTGAGVLKCSNEPSGSIKCEEILN